MHLLPAGPGSGLGGACEPDLPELRPTADPGHREGCSVRQRGHWAPAVTCDGRSGGRLTSPLQSLVNGTEHKSRLCPGIGPAVCPGLPRAPVSPNSQHAADAEAEAQRACRACPRPPAHLLARVRVPALCQVLRSQRWTKQRAPGPCAPYSLEGTRKRWESRFL